MYTHTNPLSNASLYQYYRNYTQQFNQYSFLKFNLCYQYIVAGITGTYTCTMSPTNIHACTLYRTIQPHQDPPSHLVICKYPKDVKF